jgi:hypothetical protein
MPLDACEVQRIAAPARLSRGPETARPDEPRGPVVRRGARAFERRFAGFRAPDPRAAVAAA